MLDSHQFNNRYSGGVFQKTLTGHQSKKEGKKVMKEWKLLATIALVITVWAPSATAGTCEKPTKKSDCNFKCETSQEKAACMVALSNKPVKKKPCHRLGKMIPVTDTTTKCGCPTGTVPKMVGGKPTCKRKPPPPPPPPEETKKKPCHRLGKMIPITDTTTKCGCPTGTVPKMVGGKPTCKPKPPTPPVKPKQEITKPCYRLGKMISNRDTTTDCNCQKGQAPGFAVDGTPTCTQKKVKRKVPTLAWCATLQADVPPSVCEKCPNDTFAHTQEQEDGKVVAVCRCLSDHESILTKRSYDHHTFDMEVNECPESETDRLRRTTNGKYNTLNGRVNVLEEKDKVHDEGISTNFWMALISIILGLLALIFQLFFPGLNLRDKISIWWASWRTRRPAPGPRGSGGRRP